MYVVVHNEDNQPASRASVIKSSKYMNVGRVKSTCILHNAASQLCDKLTPAKDHR